MNQDNNLNFQGSINNNQLLNNQLNQNVGVNNNVGNNNLNNMQNKPKNNKKIWLVVLFIVIVVGIMLVGGNKFLGKKSELSNSENKDENILDNSSQGSVENSQNNKLENWGVHGEIAVQAPDKSVQLVAFKWPVVTGMTAATGFAGNQDDGTVVLVNRYVPGISPENVALTDFLPAYSEQLINSFEDFYYGHYEDGTITVKSSKVSMVNGYEVCKFNGIHSYKYNDITYNDQYVAYVLATKSNGAYVYWLVQDVTTEQSKGKLIEEHALNIINSVWEVEQ